MMAVEVILVFLALLWLLYKYCTSSYTYWKDKSVPYVEPSFPFGTDKDFVLQKVTFGKHYQNIYNKFRNEKMVGGYLINKPYLLIRDPGLIKQIMVKDFHHFVDRGLIDAELLSPVNRDLFIIEGEVWRNLRMKLTPAFTSGKMKMMFHLMEACAVEFKKTLDPIAEQHGKLDVKDFVSRFTIDVISSCAFGLESNSIKNPDSEFRLNGKKLFEKPPPLKLFKQQVAFMLPGIYKLLRLNPLANDTDDFFRKIVSDTVEYREKNGVVRNDYMDLLIKIKHNKRLSEDDKSDQENVTSKEVSEPGLSLDEMTAQVLIFFAAGFETAASTMTFSLYELSLNTVIQEKLHKEISTVLQKHSGNLTYQALQEMPYLDAVINETLRRYASVSFLNRKCTKECKFPESNLVIEKDTKLIIPIFAIHHDPEYYPDPYKFDPERFLGDETKTRHNFTFLPFGEGPRMCIGNRFGLLQMKTCLAMIIKSFKVSPSEDTPTSIKIDKYNFVTSPETPIILKISNRVNE